MCVENDCQWMRKYNFLTNSIVQSVLRISPITLLYLAANIGYHKWKEGRGRVSGFGGGAGRREIFSARWPLTSYTIINLESPSFPDFLLERGSTEHRGQTLEQWPWLASCIGAGIHFLYSNRSLKWLVGLGRDAQLQATVNTSCWLLYLLWCNGNHHWPPMAEF